LLKEPIVKHVLAQATIPEITISTFIDGDKELALSHGLTQFKAQEMKWPYNFKQEAVWHISA
jgi:hypothetical protein